MLHMDFSSKTITSNTTTLSPSSSLRHEPSLNSSIREGDINVEIANLAIAPESSGVLSSSARRDQVVTVMGPSEKNNGVCLTWEDLWVIAANGKRVNRAILQGLTGYAQPGEVLAIMGPSGCGKSTLLDALAGRLSSNVTQSGHVLVNGRRQNLAFGTSAYVTQDDYLMTTLTVKEAVHYSAQLQLPDSMPKSTKMEIAEMTIREMGLQEAMNTRIGGRGTKGISGGQKRRVSICMEILTRPKLLFLDEPTSGLDSAASYHVMSRIVSLTQRHGLTVVSSIHQPCAEVFELFHNLCLLSSGRIVYFGPAYAANKFFGQNGFSCPDMRNPSDHFLRTINKDFNKDIEQGLGDKGATEKVIDSLIQSYNSTETCQQVRSRIAQISTAEIPLEKKASHASFLTSAIVLTRRSFVNMYRDPGYYWLRLVIYIAISLCAGTVFYDIGHSFSSIKARSSLLMYVVSFMTVMTIGGFPSFAEEMKIFGRERLNGHYGVFAFVIANTLSAIPYLLLVSFIPGSIAYYLVGLQKGFEHFTYFILLLFTCMMVVESLMMLVASIVPDFLMGIIAGAGIQGLFMLNGGFFQLPKDLPKPIWKYPTYYIAYHRYAFEGFYKNEYLGLVFPNGNINQVDQGPNIINGEAILRGNWEMEMSYSKWVDLGVLLGMVVFYRIMFIFVIKTIERAKPAINALLAVAHPKERKQVMGNPFGTPIHESTTITTAS